MYRIQWRELVCITMLLKLISATATSSRQILDRKHLASSADSLAGRFK